MKTSRLDFTTLSLRLTVLVCVASWSGLARAQVPEGLVGLGDSIGEGVQAADASSRTQPATYLNWIAMKMGVPFPLPLIGTTPFATIGDTEQRYRLSPEIEGANLAVSGATTASLLRDAADALTVADINSETDLVLFPRQGTQIEIAEQMDPGLVICWIGNNDVLRTATSWDHLDASQLTSELDFARDFEELADRLDQMDSLVAFANIPNVTDIAFLFDNADLIRFTGSDFGLPAGHRTSIVVMLLLRLGLDDGSILQNADFVLDPSEIAIVEDRIAFFNGVIAARAADAGAPVLNINAIYGYLAANPIDVFGIPLTRNFLGGLFSLDAVHPSNVSHAIIADQMISLVNAHYGLAIPRLTVFDFLRAVLTDPHLDKDGDGQVTGRPLAGLVETLSPFFGFSGDFNDFDGVPAASASLAQIQGATQTAQPNQAPAEPLRKRWTRKRVVDALATALAEHRDRDPE